MNYDDRELSGCCEIGLGYWMVLLKRQKCLRWYKYINKLLRYYDQYIAVLPKIDVDAKRGDG